MKLKMIQYNLYNRRSTTIQTSLTTPLGVMIGIVTRVPRDLSHSATWTPIDTTTIITSVALLLGNLVFLSTLECIFVSCTLALNRTE